MRTGRVVLLLGLCLVVVGAAHAEVLFGMDDAYGAGGCGWTQSEGLYTYHYKVTNNGDSGSDFIQALLTHPQVGEFIPPLGIINALTTAPVGFTITHGFYGPEGMGQDVLWSHSEWREMLDPGESLTGFSITSAYGPGTIQAMSMGNAWNVDNAPITGPDWYAQNSGTPEPASLCLLGLTFGPLLALRRRKRAERAAA